MRTCEAAPVLLQLYTGKDERDEPARVSVRSVSGFTASHDSTS